MTVNRGEGLNATPSEVERIMITSTRQLAGGTSVPSIRVLDKQAALSALA